jgi:hypothetical protein
MTPRPTSNPRSSPTSASRVADTLAARHWEASSPDHPASPAVQFAAVLLADQHDEPVGHPQNSGLAWPASLFCRHRGASCDASRQSAWIERDFILPIQSNRPEASQTQAQFLVQAITIASSTRSQRWVSGVCGTAWPIVRSATGSSARPGELPRPQSLSSQWHEAPRYVVACQPRPSQRGGSNRLAQQARLGMAALGRAGAMVALARAPLLPLR